MRLPRIQYDPTSSANYRTPVLPYYMNVLMCSNDRVSSVEQPGIKTIKDNDVVASSGLECRERKVVLLLLL